MTICINFQNLIHLFWTAIIALNIYVIWLLYCVAKQYRHDRVKKIKALQKLKEIVDSKRHELLKKKEQLQI